MLHCRALEQIIVDGRPFVKQKLKKHCCLSREISLGHLRVLSKTNLDF